MLSENTKHFKAKFIHEITKIPEEDIIDAIYTSEELKTTRKDEHTYRTDILVKIEGHIINIEMNETYYEGLFLKNHAYLEKINSEKYEKGESYINGIRVMQINIDDFNHYKGNKLLYTFKMLEEETKEEEGSNIISYHIDLSYMKGKCYNECNLECTFLKDCKNHCTQIDDTNQKACCVTGDINHKHDINQINCCSGYKLYQYKNNYGSPSCVLKTHYGCFKSAPEGLYKNCWTEVTASK